MEEGCFLSGKNLPNSGRSMSRCHNEYCVILLVMRIHKGIHQFGLSGKPEFNTTQTVLLLDDYVHHWTEFSCVHQYLL